MKFSETTLPGAYVIEQERAADDRGFFARCFCAREFETRGLIARVVQCSISHNKVRGTLRGLHYQAQPNPEAKTVRCLKGAVYDVIVDLRRESPTRHRWIGVELTANNGIALYVPPGFAHGFVTLEDDTTLEYLISDFYLPAAARGVRYDDRTLAIAWPLAPVVISDRDRGLPPVGEALDA